MWLNHTELFKRTKIKLKTYLLMKKNTFFLFIYFLSNSFLFAQSIYGEVEFKTSSYQCSKCSLKCFEKRLSKIFSVGDYKFLPHLYFEAIEQNEDYGVKEFML